MSRNSARTKVEAMRREQARRARNQRLILVASGLVAVALIASLVTWAVVRGRPTASAAGTGLVTYANLSRNHVEGKISYPQTPPAGGDHSAAWLNCGIYDQAVPNENAVHSLEHGAIWITYQPGLPADQVATLEKDVRNQPYGLLSPYPGLPDPVVATVWGVQLRLQSADDPRLVSFIDKYADATQAPEPKGECTGGTGTPQR